MATQATIMCTASICPDRAVIHPPNVSASQPAAPITNATLVHRPQITNVVRATTMRANAARWVGSS